MLEIYTPEQSRIDHAFSAGGCCTSVVCEACGRTYFVTSPGHGDYEEGELERLRELAALEPHRYIEVSDFSYVGTLALPTTGLHVVIGCLCDPTKPLSDFIEQNAEALTAYLITYWEAVRAEAGQKVIEADGALVALSRMSQVREHAGLKH